MSDLTDAMHEAVASLPADRDRHAVTAGDLDVQVLDLDQLPPIRYRPFQATTIGDLLAEQRGHAWRRAWQVVAETLRLVLLFWASVIAVAFTDTLTDQAMEATTMLLASLGVTAVLRGLLAIRAPDLG